MNSSKLKKYRRYVVGGRSRWFYLICGILSSFIITIPIFLILSLTVSLTDFPEEYISPAIFATMVIAVIGAAFFSTANSKNSGWFNGTLVGFFYALAISVLRWILESRFYVDKDILTILLCGLLLGTIGGMAGINLTNRVKNFKARRTAK